MKRICGIVLMLTLAPLAAVAEDEGAGDGGWEGTIAAGYLASSGNTDSSSATAEFSAKYTTGNWEHLGTGRFFSASSEDSDTGEDDQTAENYMLGWKSLYNLTERDYVFGQADWIKNRFSGYPRQIFATAGYGRRVIKNDTIELNAEIGAGYADQKAINDAPPPEKVDEDGIVYTGKLDFTWIFSETADFNQTLSANVTEDNTYWESVSKVSAKLSTVLALGVSYTIIGNSDVAPGIDKTDTYTAITLDYSF